MKAPMLHSQSSCAHVSSPSRFRSISLFAAALLAGLSASTAFSQGYYPDPQSPINGNADLQVIEQHLDPSATLILPSPTAPFKTVASDLQLAAAVARAVEEELAT